MKKTLSGVLLVCASFLSAMPEIYFTYPGWVRKAVTFSFDDGVQADRKLVEIFNRYGMKGTFNVSAGRAGSKKNFLKLEEYAGLYQGHEIASHGFHHLAMAKLSPEEIDREITQDLAALEKVAGYPVRGFAYPFGQTSPEVRAALKKHGIVYARGTGETGKFFEEKDPFYWVMTGHNFAQLSAIAEKYRDYNGWGGVLSVCSIWGHSYEFDDAQNWEVIENFCKTLAHRPDIWYATNIEIVDYMAACRKLQVSVDGKILVNPTAIPVYLWIDGKNVLVEPKKERQLPLVSGIAYPNGSYPVFPGGRTKALTFSYDDGFECDRKLVDIFDRYQLKGTFNVNTKRKIDYSIYRNHEVATHGFRHGCYQLNPKESILLDIYHDRSVIEPQVGYIVRGNAWPNGARWSDFPAAREVYRACNIVYSRATHNANLNFDLPQDDWLAWAPTAHHINDGNLQEIGKRFLATEKVPALCTIWGHSFEFDRANNWDVMEKFAALMAHRPEIWYATNIEIYDYMQAVKSLQWSCDRTFCRNMSATTVFYVVNGKLYVFKPGTTTSIL
ncbi:MAG: polysaccharide deacetylase family protein [Victivallaceae bacterium]|nr:polysaccharide deacetylase family protein [Victivallaceae bacterium]